ncbi:hypothetical protein [Echinicola vietnamensis]|uniref:Uncharacterized protein n=1 Tax=Echinicola vietnamensis (strain DSM 17526 / LMG 23754 / KMM 6221) TaxID=926556 RepID=L0FUM7_ECHVK|nr:hypothetical protein [Echinicola vietnamensis]AGA76733.1 hypothetical protein Echvi_0447 [Echinicola vietnamensis DSM 17526]
MKKLIANTLLLTVVWFCACSEEQKPAPPVEEEDLTLQLSASETTVMASSTVTFKVIAMETQQTVSGADIYIDGNKINGYQHVFDEVGTQSVVAKIQGYRDSEPVTITVLDQMAEVDVYVLGGGYDEGSGGSRPLYWKNGEPAIYSHESSENMIYNKMVVADNQVYIAGERQFTRAIASAFYWENDTYVELSDPNDSDDYAIAYDICVSEGDVYVAGIKAKTNNMMDIVYWENSGESPVHVASGTLGQTGNSVVTVSGDDVYVAGVLNAAPTYWKNGEAVSLEGTGTVTDIAVSDQGDVYISGHGSNGNVTVAKYWKNGQEVILGTGEGDSEARAVFVENGDVYVAGYEKVLHKSGTGTVNVARYWKNGEAVDLTDRLYRAEANAIFVLDGKVYVAGIDFGSSGKPVAAMYWENGKAIQLSHDDHRGHAADIFVVKRTQD